MYKATLFTTEDGYTWQQQDRQRNIKKQDKMMRKNICETWIQIVEWGRLIQQVTHQNNKLKYEWKGILTTISESTFEICVSCSETRNI